MPRELDHAGRVRQLASVVTPLGLVALQPPVTAPPPVAPAPVAPPVAPAGTSLGGATVLGLAVIVGVGVSWLTVEVLKRLSRRRPPLPPNVDPPDEPFFDYCFWCTCTNTASEVSAQLTPEGVAAAVRCHFKCECPQFGSIGAELQFEGRERCPHQIRVRVCVINGPYGVSYRVTRHEIVREVP